MSDLAQTTGSMTCQVNRVCVDGPVYVLEDITLLPGLLIDVVAPYGRLVFATGVSIRVEREHPPGTGPTR